jgi:hypothetical protein
LKDLAGCHWEGHKVSPEFLISETTHPKMFRVAQRVVRVSNVAARTFATGPPPGEVIFNSHQNESLDTFTHLLQFSSKKIGCPQLHRQGCVAEIMLFKY